MNALVTIGTQVAGGALAQYVDETYPQHAKEVAGVTVTPGAMGAVGAMLGLAIFGRRIPAGAKSVITNLVGGAVVVEGVKVARDDIIPLLKGQQPAGGITAPPGAVQKSYMVSGVPGQIGCGPMGYGPTPWEAQRALMGYRV